MSNGTDSGVGQCLLSLVITCPPENLTFGQIVDAILSLLALLWQRYAPQSLASTTTLTERMTKLANAALVPFWWLMRLIADWWLPALLCVFIFLCCTIAALIFLRKCLSAAYSVTRSASSAKKTAASQVGYCRLWLASQLDPSIRLVLQQPAAPCATSATQGSSVIPEYVPPPPVVCLGESRDVQEMAIPGSRRIPVASAKGVILFMDGDEQVGMGSRVSFGGSDFILTAAHVFHTLPDVFEVTVPGGPVAITMEKASIPLVLDGTCADAVGLYFPAKTYAHLKLAKLSTAHPKPGVATVYSPGGAAGTITKSINSLKASGSIGLEYAASTAPGASGGPIMQGDSVVGVHLGARPRAGVNYGVALPFFVLHKKTDVVESAEKTSLIRLANNLPEDAVDVEFTFRRTPVEAPITTRFKSYNGGLSWADEVDDTIAFEPPRKESWMESSYFARPPPATPARQEATRFGGSEILSCLTSLTKSVEQQMARSDAFAKELSTLRAAEVARTERDLQLLTELSSTTLDSQTGTSQTSLLKQKSVAFDTKKLAQNGPHPPPKK